MSIALERGYRYEVTDVDIRLNSDVGTVCIWASGAITTLIATLNDGGEHLLVVDFDNTGGTNWTLKTSLDGAPYADQGSAAGCGLATVDTDPRVELDSASANAYLDEAAMWVNPTEFTSPQLATMFALGSAGQPLDDYDTFTTTAPGTTTTTAPGTTTAPAAVPHPADTTVGGLSGNEDFQIQSTEILAYASAFLADDAAKFPGVTANRTAYVLRGAAVFLANFQARYEDVGTAAPVDDSAHPARWQELPDL